MGFRRLNSGDREEQADASPAVSAIVATNIEGILGATTPAAATVTTLSATGDVDLGNAATDTLTIAASIDSATVYFTKETAHAIAVANSTTAATGGAALELQAGAATTGGAQAGGNMNVYAGAGDGAGAGGHVVINAGNGTPQGQIRLGGANTSAVVVTPAATFQAGVTVAGCTMPTADGTANQVLKTDGSGAWAFASAVYAQQEATGTITTEEILALNAAAKTLIASPGAGKINVVDEIELFLDFGSVAYVRDGGNEELVIEYSGGQDIHAFANATDTFLTSGADAHRLIRPTIYDSAAAGFAPTGADDEAIQAKITQSEVITGDSPIKWKIRYRTITLLT